MRYGLVRIHIESCDFSTGMNEAMSDPEDWQVKSFSFAVNVLNAGSAKITEWDEDMIRQLVDTVKVLSADRIRVYLRGGMEIEQTIEGGR